MPTLPRSGAFAALLLVISCGAPATAEEDSAPAPPPADAGSPAEPPLAQALAVVRGLRRQGKLGEAAAAARAAEKRLGENAELRLEAAWALFEQMRQEFDAGSDKFVVKGLLADARLRVDQARAMDADVAGGAVLLAKLLRYEEDPDAARAALAAQVEKHPGDAAAHAELGDLAWNARDWEEVDRRYTKVAELDPTDGDARLRATIAKQWLGVAADRIEAGYLLAAKLLPENQRPLELLVKLHKSPDRQLATMEKVIAENPRAVWARIWSAWIVRTRAKPDLLRAREILDEAAAIAPDEPAVHHNLGELLEQAGAPLEALAAYGVAVEKGAPDAMRISSDAADRLLHADPKSKDVPLDLRERIYGILTARNPTEGRYGNNAGLWHRDVSRDYEKSLKHYLASVRAAPDDQDYLNDTALIYLFHLTDRKEQCLPMFEKVVRLVEEDGQDAVRGYWDTLENLCKYWFERGEYEKVIAWADKRADPSASLNGKPYPSAAAAMWRSRALAEMVKAKAPPR